MRGNAYETGEAGAPGTRRPLLGKVSSAHLIMVVAGALWAQNAWGRYWNWDPLEVWSLMTWLSIAIALHLRVTRKPSPAVGALICIGVFVLAFLTFFGVPFISTAVHKGAI